MRLLPDVPDCIRDISAIVRFPVEYIVIQFKPFQPQAIRCFTVAERFLVICVIIIPICVQNFPASQSIKKMHRVRSNFFRIDHGVDPIFETVVPRTLYMAEIPDDPDLCSALQQCIECRIIPVIEYHDSGILPDMFQCLPVDVGIIVGSGKRNRFNAPSGFRCGTDRTVESL